VIDLLVVEVILQIPINWFQFLIHITLRVVAQVLDSQSMTYDNTEKCSTQSLICIMPPYSKYQK
jgi:hypothetical protein